MLNMQRAHYEREERERYAQAARDLRRYAAVQRYTDPTIDRLQVLLFAAASVLEAAGRNLPAGREERGAVEGLAIEVERLVPRPAAGEAAPPRSDRTVW